MIILADNQDITRVGMMYVCEHQEPIPEICRAADKTELIEQLKSNGEAVVVLDYTHFVRRAIALSSLFSVLLKDSPLSEIRDCLRYASRGQRYICQRMAEILLAPAQDRMAEDVRLTRTEMEILKDIALGMTTREIAEKRFSSFHTVNTHRKNIFRKLGLNTVHEATKYALRAGLVDSAEYYI